MEEEFNNNSFGIVTGTSQALPFPSIKSEWMRIKNSPNSNFIGYIGSYGYTPFPLSPGEDTGWFKEDNSGDIYYRGTGTYFCYWFQN